MESAGSLRVDPPVGAPPPLSLEVVAGEDGFDALGPDWRELHARACAGPFQSFEWLRAWWSHLAPRGTTRLHLVTVRHGDRLAGLAPLLLERVPAPPLPPLRRLGWLGAGMSDYLDLLLEPGLEEPVLERLAGHLAARADGWDVLALSDIPAASHLRAGLGAALARHGLATRLDAFEVCPRTRLSPRWEDTLAAIGADQARKLRRFDRQLSRQHAVEVEVAGGPASLAADVEEFMAMHQARHQSLGRRGVYADGRAAAFQREVAARFAERGWLYLRFLKVDGVRVAALFAFLHGGVAFYYLGGLRGVPGVTRFSPGNVLFGRCMRALGDQGVTALDFLRGAEDYKYRLGAVDVPTYALQAYHPAAWLARPRHVLALLGAAAARRVAAERLAFARIRAEHGLASRAALLHLARRLGAVVRDGLAKLRAPHRPAYLARVAVQAPDAAGGAAAQAEGARGRQAS